MAKSGSGINRTINIPQPNLFGRIGTGFGQGLAEQLPKEVERNRLASGLKNLGEQKGLTPFQQFSGLASLPGTTPQIIQSGADILRQQQYIDAINKQYADQGGPQANRGGSYIPNQEELNQPTKGEIPTLATPEATAESYKTYIPSTEQDERKDAYENFNKNPARYNYDYNEALKERKGITARNQEIQTAYNEQEKTAVAKEEKVKGALKAEIDKLGLKNIPPKAYQKFEEKILNGMLSKKEGGEGLTQEQAVKKFSKELNQADRNYLDLNSLSAWSPRDWNRRTNVLQKDFAERDELQPMMDQLITSGVSPSYAAHKTYPIKKGEMPTLNKLGIQVGTTATKAGVAFPVMNDITYEQLKKEMGKTHAPLSIAYELQNKGQDPRGFLKYLDNHRDNLEVWQADQLNKNLNVIDLKDKWLQAWE